MAYSSLLLPPLSSTTTTIENRELSGSSTGSAFLHNPKLLFAGKPRKGAFRRCGFKSPVARRSLDHIPKQFREENLKDGLMDNYKNAPQSLYGLTPSQMNMFMTEDNPVRRQAEKVTEESLSSGYNYLNNGGMWSMSGMNERRPSKYSMTVSMYRGGARGYGTTRTAPPDLPSLLLDGRIVYLGMPMVPAVTELLVAQLMWLNFDSDTKPIYLYINSPGTQNEKMESVAVETEAYAIADSMALCKPNIYTINIGMAYGQAAMLLSLGAKGYRALLAHSTTKLYLPKVHRSSGAATDMWIKANELDANTEYYLELLAKGTGKTKEELKKDIEHPKYLGPLEAIDYGIADRIMDSLDAASEKRDYEAMVAQRAMNRAKAGPQAAPSGLR